MLEKLMISAFKWILIDILSYLPVRSRAGCSLTRLCKINRYLYHFIKSEPSIWKNFHYMEYNNGTKTPPPYFIGQFDVFTFKYINEKFDQWCNVMSNLHCLQISASDNIKPDLRFTFNRLKTLEVRSLHEINDGTYLYTSKQFPRVDYLKIDPNCLYRCSPDFLAQIKTFDWDERTPMNTFRRTELCNLKNLENVILHIRGEMSFTKPCYYLFEKLTKVSLNFYHDMQLAPLPYLFSNASECEFKCERSIKLDLSNINEFIEELPNITSLYYSANITRGDFRVVSLLLNKHIKLKFNHFDDGNLPSWITNSYKKLWYHYFKLLKQDCEGYLTADDFNCIDKYLNNWREKKVSNRKFRQCKTIKQLRVLLQIYSC